jgi:hypothetical protein
MKKACSFLIVCLFFTACKAPQQVVSKEVIVTLTDTVFVAAPVPATENVAVETFPWENPVDWFRVEDSTSFAEIKMEVDSTAKQRRYTVKHGRKADTVIVHVPIVLTDTFYIKTGCSPCPTLPKNGKFPWALVLASLAAVVLFFTVGKKGESVR